MPQQPGRRLLVVVQPSLLHSVLLLLLLSSTTLKSAIAASSRNGTRIYPILLCHFMTQNQKLQCSPETFRLSFYGIQGVPKKILAQLEPRFWKSVVENKIFLLDPWRDGMSKAQIFFGTPWIP